MAEKNLVSTLTRHERLRMIEWADAELPLSEQADLLSMSRASLYYSPRPPAVREIAIKHRIDAIYTEHPYYGARRMSHTLGTEGLVADRKTVRAYVQQMGLEAIYPKPNLSKPAPGRPLGHRNYPYLLRNLTSSYPNHIRASGSLWVSAYVRMQSGWMYLVAILDWYSRYVVSWEIAQTLEIGFVLD